MPKFNFDILKCLSLMLNYKLEELQNTHTKKIQKIKEPLKLNNKIKLNHEKKKKKQRFEQTLY